MSMEVKFTKMHGLGNDFIFVDKKDLPAAFDIKPAVISLSRRHTGIGCDQFIIYDDQDSFIDISIYNSDGSSAQACGNATRCLSYLFSKIKNTEHIKISVQGRVLECAAENADNVSVNMGEVKFDCAWMPSYESLAKELSPYLSSSAQFLCADIGNPHLVIIDPNLSQDDMSLLGPRLEKSALFPNGVNVNFANILDDVIELKVWERGAGFTYACGSGACASFAACHKLGFVPDNAKVKFELGTLDMKLESGEVIMNGKVALVAMGIFYYG